jgi:hypothetical protein
MTDYPQNPGPLPAVKLQNAGESEEARGALGNEAAGNMYYTGGDRAELVRTLQMMLRDLLYDIGNFGPDGDGVDGIFGKKTEDAVKQFQQENKDWDSNPLKVDGLVGPRTSDALNKLMVGKWYDEYVTPKTFTDDYLLATITSTALMGGISLDVKGTKNVKLNVVSGDYTITLFDQNGERLLFDGIRHYKVLDGSEKILGEGDVECKDDIVVKAITAPYKVELEFDKDSTFYYISKIK